MTPTSPDAAEEPRIRCYACAEHVHPDARKCRWCNEWYADAEYTHERHHSDVTAAQAAVRYPLDEGGGSTTSDDASRETEEITPSMMRVDAISLEVGAALASAADPDYGDAALLDRLKHVRHQLAMEFGVITPRVRVRPHPSLEPGQYRIRIKGDLVAEDDVQMFDAQDVVSTHVAEVVKRHLAELLTREEVAELLNMARQDAPMVVQELVPNMLALGQLRQVLQNLVKEQVPIKDLSTILNALADNAVYTKDPHALTEHARAALGRKICARYQSPDGALKAFTLSPDAGRAIQNAIQLNETGQVLMLDPSTSQTIQNNLAEALESFRGQILDPVLITAPKIRRHVKALLERNFSTIVVLSHSEIVPGVHVDNLQTIDVDSFRSSPVDISSPTSDWLMGG